MSLAVAAASVISSSGCVSPPHVGEQMDEVVISSSHPHSVEVLAVTVIGNVPDIGRRMRVTATFSETKPELDRLTIVDTNGKTIVVPRSYFEKVQMPRENSLEVGYLMAEDSNTVAGISIFLDYGDLRRRANLNCTNDRGDPVFKSFELRYDTRARTFETLLRDYCGEPG